MNTCNSCRFFLPTGDTHYNKPCGYCGNHLVGKRRVSDDKACKLFEQASRVRKKETQSS